MGGLPTVRPLPSRSLEQIDPFLLLNHHGPVTYEPKNDGLPFEPHPHRGMQTVTFIVDGDVKHKDNSGGSSIIEEGGVQWMVAGEGLLHSEVSSDDFKREGGDLEILQLWVNLPADKKDVSPDYAGLSAEDITEVETDEGRVRVRIVAGEFDGQQGPYEPLTDVELYWLDLDEAGTFETTVPSDKNIFCYVVDGRVTVNGESVDEMHLVEFGDTGDQITLDADEESLVLWGTATPYDEPVVSQGPFVMNTQDEIQQAWEDLRAGKFGTWKV
jgi:redox-sensitive bicupin YhaK (pirin superfamily)